ncbi:ribonuclease HII [Peribacillus sp. SCS-37]|uniref:ribonuclease HII n=1 Tax=Paraperibacillus esterisolvens TaxID=3115296 RepID=UPI0039063EB5
MMTMSIKQAADALAHVKEMRDPFLQDCLRDARRGLREAAERRQRALQKEEESVRKFEEMSRYENRLRSEGFSLIAGIDEAGRGPLAGPVVAAAVILPQNFFLAGLNDSKQIPKQKLRYFYEYIREHALSIGIGIIHSDVIDEINIYQAAKSAMVRSIADLAETPDYLLVDAMELPAPFPQESIIKGDAASISIAAASIMAKVTRDEMMKEYGSHFPQYNFANNAGYGTQEHLKALDECGLTAWHRKSFGPVKAYI